MHTNGELLCLGENLPRGADAVVFDVGANVGDWCKAVLDINPQAQVHCFEPSSFAFERLIGRNFPANVVCNNIGLSSSSSVQRLALFGWKSYYNSLYPDRRFGIEPERYEEVWLETLTNYCERHSIGRIDYLKIDVEGHELDVLQGAAEMLLERRIRTVQFEYCEAYIAAGVFLRDVVDFVAQFDYDLYKVLSRGVLPVREWHPKLENFRYSNYALLLRNRDN